MAFFHVENNWGRVMFRAQTVEMLRFLKRRMTYSRMADLFDLPATVLSRYIQGHVLPNFERARELYGRARRVLHDLVVEMVRPGGNGFFDITPLLSEKVPRQVFAAWVADRLVGTRVDRILTAAVDGVPLAVSLSDLLDVPVAIAKKEREAGVAEFWTATVEWPSGRVETLWLPRHSLRRREWVVVVDDLVRTGETLRTLARLVERVGARLVGAFALVGVRPHWRRVAEELGAPLRVFVEVSAR